MNNKKQITNLFTLGLAIIFSTLTVLKISVSPCLAETTTIDLRQSFPDTQGDNGFFAYGYASATNSYRLLTDAGSNHFNTPEEGNWNNPHVGGAGSPYDWYGEPWIALFPSGTASNIGSPEDAVLAWIVPKTALYQLVGGFYVPSGSLNGADTYIKNNDTLLWSSYISPGATQDFDVASMILNAGDTIYFGAGAHNDVYFSEYNDWPFLRGQIFANPAPIVNINRSNFAASVIGNKIYVFGGHNNGQSNSLTSTEMLDLTTSSWIPLADNVNNNGTGGEPASGATMDGKFYVSGSFGGYSPKGTVNFIQEYDPANDIWTAKAAMPSTHFAATAVAYNDEIYVFGGVNVIKNKPIIYRVVDAYKPTANTWRKVTQMPQLRVLAAVTVVDNKAYVIGGVASITNMTTYSNISVYNFATRKWKTSGLTPLPTARAFSYGHSAPVLNGKMYLVGGMTSRKSTKAELKATGIKYVSTLSDKVEIYDPVSNTWQMGPSLPQPSVEHVAVVANDTIYLLGGSATSDNVVWTLTDTWKASLTKDETCDLNADGKFSSKDTALFLADCKNGTAYWNCDLNNDGKFNSKDLSAYNLQWKYNKISCMLRP